jgi:hypothetical protein
MQHTGAAVQPVAAAKTAQSRGCQGFSIVLVQRVAQHLVNSSQHVLALHRRKVQPVAAKNDRNKERMSGFRIGTLNTLSCTAASASSPSMGEKSSPLLQDRQQKT